MTEAASTKSTIQETWFSGLRGSLYVLRVPIVMAAVTVVALTIPEQVQEVYVVLAQDRAGTPGFQYRWILALLALFALALVFWQVATRPQLRFLCAGDGTTASLGAPGAAVAAAVAGDDASVRRRVWACGCRQKRQASTSLLEGVRPEFTQLSADIEKGIGICIALGIVVFVITLILEYRMRDGTDAARCDHQQLGGFPIIAVVSVVLLALDPIRISPRLSGSCRSLLCGWQLLPCWWACWPGSAFSPYPFLASC